MVPGAITPAAGSAVNAILAALQRGPEAIRLPATPFIMPAATPGLPQADATPGSFSRLMMGQLLAAMDRTAAAPANVLSSVSPHLEGVPTGLAAPPPLSGPVVGPPPGRGSPGTAPRAVPLADGGNTPGQQETDQIGTSSGEVRPLAALPASSLTRLSAAARALIRVAPTDPTAVEPLRGAMLRSVDSLEALASAPPAARATEPGEPDSANPLRPLRRAIELAPAAELVSLAQLIVQSTPPPPAVITPETPRTPAPVALPQPGQRFQDVLAAVSARSDVESLPVMPSPAAAVPPPAGTDAPHAGATPPPAAPEFPAGTVEAAVAPAPAVIRSVAVSAALSPEAEVARSANHAYDATSRYAPRPMAPVVVEPLSRPTVAAPLIVAVPPASPAVNASMPVPDGEPVRSSSAVPASRQSAGESAAIPHPVAPAVASGAVPATRPGATAVAPVTTHPAALRSAATTAIATAPASGPVSAPHPVPAIAPTGIPAVRVAAEASAPVAHPDVPGVGLAHVSSAQVVAPAPAPIAGTALAQPAAPAIVRPGIGSVPVAANQDAPAAPATVFIPQPGTGMPVPVAVTASDAPSAPATVFIPQPGTGMPVAMASTPVDAPAVPAPNAGATAEPALPSTSLPAAQVLADTSRPLNSPLRPAGDEPELPRTPREDAGALFARIHAAASGRAAGGPATDAASRPAYPALADALDRIASELSRAQTGAPRSLEMNIDAPDLGRVRIRVAMTDAGTVAIELVTPSERAATALRADLPQLTASLEGRGQVVNGAQVTVAAAGFMTGQDGTGQSRPQHRWFEARGGRRTGEVEEDLPVAGATAAYARRWSSVDLVA